MKKISGIEWAVLLLTAVFFLGTLAFFLWSGKPTEMTRVEVSRSGQQTLPVETTEENSAPGILEGERINLNSAPLEDLIRLPGIGQTKAQAIVSYREENGPFQEEAELMQVPGIGQATFEKLLPYITAEA